MEFIPEELYARIVDAVPICTVDLALFDREGARVLLFQRTGVPLAGVWFTPGGRMRKNETLADCALRQARDEAGLILDPAGLRLAGVFDEIHDVSRFGGPVTYHCVNVCYAYRLEGDPTIRLDRQHSAYAWFAPDDASLHPMVARKAAAAAQAVRGR